MESETSNSSCSDWQHYTLEIASYPPEKSADPIFPVGAVLEGLNGLWFDALELSASHTNYDHEDLLESIEVFRTRGYKVVKKDIKKLHKLLLVIICL